MAPDPVEPTKDKATIILLSAALSAVFVFVGFLAYQEATMSEWDKIGRDFDRLVSQEMREARRRETAEARRSREESRDSRAAAARSKEHRAERDAKYGPPDPNWPAWVQENWYRWPDTICERWLDKLAEESEPIAR